MPRRTIILIALACLVLGAPAPAAAQQADPPSERVLYEDGHEGRFLLDGRWLFRADPTDQGAALGFPTQPGTEGWTPVEVPHVWNAGDDSAESQRGGVGWYRRDFRLPRGSRGMSFRLRFESVNYRATVFLNGNQVGAHEGARIPFEVPADSLDRDGVNRLVVRVDSRRTNADLPPATEDEVTGLPGGGWWNYGGLTREVYLRAFRDVDLEDLLVRPEIDGNRATVLLRARLTNPGGGSRRVSVRARVGSRRVESRPVLVGSGGSREVSERVTLSGIRRWSPGRPFLYSVRAEVTEGNDVLSGWRARVGLRELEVEDGRLRLNGRSVRLRGASIHEDDPKLGSALGPGERRAIFKDLTDLGATLTRSHYPLHPHFLEMADEQGVLVWDQIPYYRMSEGEQALPGVHDRGLAYLSDTIRRDRNHASVLAWSVGNELPRNPGPAQTRWINDSLRLVGRLDPTRLRALDIAGYPSVRLVPLYRKLDALGSNAYFGWYPGPYGSVLSREVLGPYLDQLREYYPEVALFVTEFGAEANRSGPAEEKGTFEFQTELMRYHLGVYDDKDYLSGAVAWLLRDFKVRPDWNGYNDFPSPPYNKKGVVDENGRRKPAFDEVARRYKAVRR
jgi:beta-glucuronidase